MTRPVVVGIVPDRDNTPPVRWAAREALACGVGVHLVHGLVVPTGSHPGEHLLGLDVRGALGARGRDELSRMAELIAEEAPSVSVTRGQVSATAVESLCDAAASASMVVLGTDRLGPVADRLLGGIARAVCGRVEVPVVTVPSVADPAGPRDAAVVVGDDGTPGSGGALRFASERAAALHAPLVVVRARPDHASGRTLTTSRPAGAGPEVHVVVADTRPDRLLLDQAANASMVVLGRGEHHWWRGPRPTRPDVVAHAPCPVVTVPPEWADEAQEAPPAEHAGPDVVGHRSSPVAPSS